MNLCKVCASRFCIDLDAAQLGRKASESDLEAKRTRKLQAKRGKMVGSLPLYLCLQEIECFLEDMLSPLSSDSVSMFSSVQPCESQCVLSRDQEASISPKAKTIIDSKHDFQD